MKLWKFTLIAALALQPLTVWAQALSPLKDIPAGKYELDKNHASVIWKVNHMSLSNYTSRFTGLDADLNFDPKHPEKSKLIAKVDPNSIQTDYKGEVDFNKELATSDKWFNSGKYPEIKFESNRIEVTGTNKGTVYGNLTMLGITKPIFLDVTFNGGYKDHPMMHIPIIGFSAVGKIKRSDWGLSYGSGMLGEEVEIIIEAEFTKPKN